MRWILAPLLGVLALGCGPALDAQLDEAQALVVAGQPAAALPLLEGVVRRKPDDGAANLLLGQVLLQTGQTRPAVSPLTRALESEPHAVPAGLLLASAYLREGRPEEALGVVDRVLAGHPGQAAALRIRATSQLQLGHAERAAADAQRLLELSPDDPQAPVLLGMALTRLGRLDEAERVLVALERQARESEAPGAHARACTALASFLAAGRQDPAGADLAWRRCLERHPTDAVVLQGATSFFDQRGDGASSLAALRHALETEPEALGVRMSLGRRLAAAGSPEEGEALLRAAAEGGAGWAGWQALASFRQERGDAIGAVAAQEHALAGVPEEHADAIRFPYAMMLLDTGRQDDAKAVREQLVSPALVDLLDGRLHLAEGDAGGALEAFERGTARNPGDARGHYLIGLAAQALGRFDRALAAYSAAFERDPGATDAALAAARLHYALGEHASALDLLQRHRSARGATGRREAALLSARATAALGEHAAAAALIERWLAGSEAPDAEAVALLVEILGHSQGTPAALARLEREREAGLDLAAQDSLPALRAYALQLLRMGQAERALAATEAALERSPQAVELHRLRATLLAASGQDAAAEATLRRALELAPGDPRALAALGSWLHGQGRGAEALAVLERAHQLGPTDPEPTFLAARILAEQGQGEEAERRLRAVVAQSPLHLGACNDLAWRLAETRRDLDLALELARRVTRLSPGGATFDTLGWVQLARGDAHEAVASLEQAVAREPGVPGFRYRLGLALSRSGREAEARQAFRAALAHGDFAEAEHARTELARLGG